MKDKKQKEPAVEQQEPQTAETTETAEEPAS